MMSGTIRVKKGDQLLLRITTTAEIDIRTQQPLNEIENMRGVAEFVGGGQSGVYLGAYRIGNFDGESDTVSVERQWKSTWGEGKYRQTMTHRLSKEG